MTRRTAAAIAVILAVFSAQFAWVRATNFGGWDEWLIIQLTSMGVVSLPYQNRLALVFSLPGSLLSPHGLWGFYWVHGFYLAGSGVFTYLLARRLAPDQERLALLAGILGTVWAPRDDIRLDVVLGLGYSGLTFVSLGALLLLVEAHRRRSVPLVLTAGCLGAAVVLCVEVSAALLLAGPLVLLALDRDRRSWTRSSLVFGTPVGCAVAVVAARVVFPAPGGSYQTKGLGFDPHPWRVLGRIARLLGHHLGPLAQPSALELATPAVAASVGLFLVCWWATGRAAPAAPRRLGSVWRLAAVGLAGGILGDAILALSPSITSPARTQILAAPAIGLFLASAIVWVADRLPLRRDVVMALLAGYVVGVGTARTVAMQQEWDGTSYWAGQRRMLVDLVQQVPDFTPGTLVVLLDGTSAWPATFTFRHAVEYLYRQRAAGVAWGAEPFLYPVAPGPSGFISLPLPSIRGPWRQPARVYGYDELVVVRALPDGGLRLLDEWPADALPRLPDGAVYAPRKRMGPGPAGPERMILEP